MKKNVVLYPGTFDPITHGHADLIQRAAHLFDQVIVGIAQNTKKSPLLSAHERKHLVEVVLAHVPNLEVCCFEGLTIDLAKQKQANLLLRGVRGASDLEAESSLSDMNKALYPKIETIFLLPSVQYRSISSTLVKEIVAMKGDVSSFVDERVKDKLMEVMRDRGIQS